MLRRSFLAAAVAGCGGTIAGQTKSRPRLFFDASGLAQLKRAIAGTHDVLWTKVRKDADSFAAGKPPAYHGGEDDEQLWQREVGNKLPFLALAHLLTGEKRYLDAAAAWSRACCGYATWGTGIRNGVDLSAGRQMFGLALVYDWLYDVLPEADRALIRSTLLTRGAVLYRAGRDTAYWKNSVLQNHLWVNMAGFAAASLALDEPESSPWAALAAEKFAQTCAVLGPDGASHEGVPYWSYGVEYLLKYAGFAGAGLRGEWWKHTAAYRLYMGLPRNSWDRNNTLVDIADAPREDYYVPIICSAGWRPSIAIHTRNGWRENWNGRGAQITRRGALV